MKTRPILVRWLAGSLAAVSSLIAPAAANAQRGHLDTIMLKDRGEIADADAVNEAIDALVKHAQTCTPRSEACICSFTSGVERLNDAFHAAVAKHPSWGRANTGIEYDDPKGGTTAIGMSNVRRQLEMCGR